MFSQKSGFKGKKIWIINGIMIEFHVSRILGFSCTNSPQLNKNTSALNIHLIYSHLPQTRVTSQTKNKTQSSKNCCQQHFIASNNKVYKLASLANISHFYFYSQVFLTLINPWKQNYLIPICLKRFASLTWRLNLCWLMSSIVLVSFVSNHQDSVLSWLGAVTSV